MTANADPEQGTAGVIATFRNAPAAARVLIFGMLLNRLGAFLPFFLVLFVVHKGNTVAQAGFTLGAYGVGGIIGGVVGGWVTDRFGCRRTIVASSAAAAGFTIAIFYAPSLSLLVVNVAAVGALSYAYRPASSALLAETVPPSRYTMIFAMYRLAMSLGTAGGPLIGAALIVWGYGPLFWVEGGVLVVFALVAQFALPPDSARARTPRKDAEQPSETRTPGSRMWQDHRYLIFLGSALMVSVVYFQHLSTLPLQIVNDGMPIKVYAALVALNALIVAAFELPLTKVVQHWSPRTALLLNYILIGAGMALYAFGWGLAGLLIATLVWSIGEIIGAPTFFSYPAKIAPEGMRGRYLGASGAMLGLGFAIGPAVGAPLWSMLGRTFWLVCGLVCVLAAMTLYAGVLPAGRSNRVKKPPAPSAADQTTSRTGVT